MSHKSTRTISVQHRGDFKDDAFFKDSWDEWDSAMKDAVERWDKHSGTTKTHTIHSKPSATKNTYRQMRTSNVTSDESQAVSCTEEADKYKMVMDVKDFNPEDISVKAVDDTIVIEGKIIKKEGNSTTTQKFTRRFLLPAGVNMNAVGSALSKDGVLTVSAPKLALTSTADKTIPVLRSDNTITGRVMGPMPRSSVTKIYGHAAAGKPSSADNEPFNPTGGSNTSVYETPKKDLLAYAAGDGVMVGFVDTERKGSKTNWNSFNNMVEKSQREMEDMMKKHSLTPDDEVPLPLSHVTTSKAVANAGANVNRDVIRDGNTVTHRQEQKWDDKPAPGVNRTNRDYQESSEILGDDGQVVGNKKKKEQESHAEGHREEILPDGTKCKIFTKSYETKNSYVASSGNAKAL